MKLNGKSNRGRGNKLSGESSSSSNEAFGTMGNGSVMGKRVIRRLPPIPWPICQSEISHRLIRVQGGREGGAINVCKWSLNTQMKTGRRGMASLIFPNQLLPPCACVVRPVIDRPLTMDVSLEIILGSSRSSHSGVCCGTAGGEEEC